MSSCTGVLEDMNHWLQKKYILFLRVFCWTVAKHSKTTVWKHLQNLFTLKREKIFLQIQYTYYILFAEPMALI